MDLIRDTYCHNIIVAKTRVFHESLNRMTKNKLYKDPTEWTEWTECSKWCEKGIQARQRLKASADITRGNRADIERKC